MTTYMHDAHDKLLCFYLSGILYVKSTVRNPVPSGPDLPSRI
jgi:hypothetical protein